MINPAEDSMELPCLADVPDAAVFVAANSVSLAAEQTAVPVVGSGRGDLVTRGTLEILVLTDAATLAAAGGPAPLQSEYVLQINDWMYVLAGQPVLQVGVGQFLLLRGVDDSETPPYLLHCPPDAATLIRDVIIASCTLREMVTETAVAAGSGEPLVSASALSVASGIVKTGEALSYGIVTAASYLGGGIKWSGEKLVTLTAPATEKAVIGENTKAVVGYARTAAGAAASVTGSALGFVSSVASAVGVYASEKLKTSDVGKRLASWGTTGGPQGEEAARKRAAVATVAASTVVAGLTVWESLENAGRLLLKDTTTAAHTVVAHRYGADAGGVAKAVGGAICDTASAAVNMRRIGVRPFAKAAAVAAVKSSVGSGIEDEKVHAALPSLANDKPPTRKK